MQDNITNDIIYIGVDDTDIDLFESQYIVPDGISYNSYVIKDEKTTIFDTADNRKLDEWCNNLLKALDGTTPDYLVVSHMEPDHAAGIAKVAELFPSIQIVGNAKTFTFMSQFFEGKTFNEYIVKEGDVLSLGKHNLTFVFAPMVHWPEVMLAYEATTQTLFSADAFGKFGIPSAPGGWACEARRYYYNIVGKYGANVQTLLKKLAGTPVQTIAPLHGPILRENLGYYIDMYDKWSSYQAEEDGVLICYASIHGNTAKVAKELKNILIAKGKENVELCDLSREDMAEAVENAFCNENLVLAASSYDAGVFPPMAEYLHHLKDKNFQNRKVGIIENGTWAPSAARVIRTALDGMKNINIIEPVVTIRSTYKTTDIPALEALADALISK